MYKPFCSIIVIYLIILTGCSDSPKYNDEDVAVIVRGEEITIGELRFLYLDEEILNMIDGTIKAKLVIQEAKKLNIDVSKEVKETIEALGDYPPDHIKADTENSIREFAEIQAKKLGVTPEEYYKKYIEKTTETSAYINSYIQEVLGEPMNDIEKYNQQANKLLNELVEENKDEIKVLINN
jgi:HJR/Mrr/RecB family endonuclease